jgi:hypothetical protein
VTALQGGGSNPVYFDEIEEQEEEEALGARCVALCDKPELIRSYTRYHWWPKVA